MISKFQFYRVATGHFPVRVADVNANTEAILAILEKAKKDNVQVLVFPELSLTGYTCQDLFFNPAIIGASYASLADIAKEVPEDMLVFVGLPLVIVNNLYNVAAVLSGGHVVGVVPKTYLPNSGEYYEQRWFTSGDQLGVDEVGIAGEIAPVGTDLLFNFGQLIVGCELCEDLWTVKSPSDDAVLAGANLIVNLSASDETVAKREYRRDLVRIHSAKDYCAYLYASSGLGESSQDLVFSGHHLLYQEGIKVFEAYDEPGLHEGLIDVERIRNDRLRDKCAFGMLPDKDFRIIHLESANYTEILPDKVNPHPFLVEGDKREERSAEILSLQSRGLQTRLRNIDVDHVVLGVSGGLDSTLALLVCKDAFDRLGYPTKNIHAFSMPSKATSDETFDNAKKLCKAIGCSYEEIPIGDMLSTHLKAINHKEEDYDTAYENAQARIRTIILMDKANMLDAIVVGTSDLSEACLGFSTYNGDHMSMYGVNISVPKTLVRVLIVDYGKAHPELGKVLNAIVDTPISPELIPGKKGKIAQKTEEIIGSYELHDFFIYHMLRNGFAKDKIFALAKIAFPKIDEKVIRETLETFYSRLLTQQFKRSCLPDGVKVGSVAISPRGDLRMPSDIDDCNVINFGIEEPKKEKKK